MKDAAFGDTADSTFSLDCRTDDGVIELRLRGNGDMEAVAALGRQTSVVHGQAQRLKVKLVRVDLVQLYFLNSSCLKAFASLIALDLSLPVAERYRIVFRIGLPWQRRTFAALRSLGRDVVSIEDGCPVD